MSTEVAIPDTAEISRYDASADSAAFLKLIREAAVNPEVNVEKMERLMAMKERFDADQAKRAFTAAMNRVQPKLPRVKKNGAIEIKAGVKLTYARYEDIHAAVMPLLVEEGFTVSYSSEVAAPGLLRVTVTLKHVQGHSDSGSVFLPMTDESGAKNKVQGAGSILSYGKRYALCNYLDIVTEGQDDDGQQGLMEPISDKQVTIIVRLIEAAKCGETAFLKYMKVDCIADIKVRDYLKATTALQNKLGEAA